MVYRFEDDEVIAAGLERVASEALGAAAAALRSPGIEGIHDARTGVKRVRALLRLIRPVLGEVAFTEQSARLRAIGRALAPARDAAVLVEMLDELRERSPAALGDRIYEELRERLVTLREASAIDEATRSAAIAGLSAASASIAGWSIEASGFRALTPGLRRVYAAGQARFERERRSPDDEHAHALRKRVKDLGYLMALLEAIWPPVMVGTHDAFKKLGDRLGEDRDLSRLQAALTGEAFLLPAERELALSAIAERRESLRDKIYPLGLRVFAERPRRFTARLGAYWKAWRSAKGN